MRVTAQGQLPSLTALNAPQLRVNKLCSVIMKTYN